MAEIIRTYFDYDGDYVEEWTDEELEDGDYVEEWTEEELAEANRIAYESYKSESDSYHWED